MSLITRMRRQAAVYWKRLTPDEWGAFSYDTPVEIECRWDDSNEEFRDAKGETLTSRATVYPDRVVYPGDIMLKGEQESDTPNDPTTLDDTFEVKRFDSMPNLKATEFLYVAYLA